MGLGWTIVALIAVLAVAWRFLGSSGCRSRSPLSRHTTSASGSKTPPAAAPGSASRSLPRNSPPRRSNRLPQVLIVDDDPDLLNVYGSLQPGGSVPDVRVLACDPGAPADSGPRAIWLHELLSPSRLNLLLAGESYSAVAPSAWLGQLQPWRELISVHQVTPVRDPEEQFRFYRAFGDGQSLVLVRPDLYVSFAGGQQALPHLLTWLNTWFPPAPGGDRHVRRRQLAGRLRRV